MMANEHLHARKDPQKLKFRISECPGPGLSLRGGGWGFSQATTNLAPGYFHRKIKKTTILRALYEVDFPKVVAP